MSFIFHCQKKETIQFFAYVAYMNTYVDLDTTQTQRKATLVAFDGIFRHNCCPLQMIKPKPEGLALKACPLTVSTLHTSHFLGSNHSHRVSVTNEGAGKNKLMVFLITLVGLNLSENCYHQSYHCDFLQNLVFVIMKIINILIFALVILTLNQ